jgi:hypothetical protein
MFTHSSKSLDSFSGSTSELVASDNNDGDRRTFASTTALDATSYVADKPSSTTTSTANLSACNQDTLTKTTATTRLVHRLAQLPRRLKHKLHLGAWSSAWSSTTTVANSTNVTSASLINVSSVSTATSTDLLYDRVSKLVDKCSNALSYIRCIVDKQQQQSTSTTTEKLLLGTDCSFDFVFTAKHNDAV